MAIGAMNGGGVWTGSNQVVVPVSCRGVWHITNDDLVQAVPATPLNPATITSQYCHWVKVPNGAGKCIVRARSRKANTFTTDAVVRIIGAYCGPLTVINSKGEFISEDGSMVNDGTIEFMRLDLAASTGTGITLDVADAGTNMMFDAASTPQAYSDPTTITPIDLLGAWYVMAVPVTAAAYNSGTGTTPCELLFMN